MAKQSKRAKAIAEKVETLKTYACDEAFELMQSLPPCKFNQTVELAVILGIDPRKSDQMVRGSTVLPHGTGRTMRIAVFAQGPAAEEAKAAGADIVGFEDLADSVKKGELNFDVVIATPDAMKLVGQLGQVLGPRGLMPNPKVGTVTPNVAQAVKNAKAGQATYRADKAGILHTVLGKLDFTPQQLKENLEAVIADVKKLKPASAKGVYIKKVSVSSTMGPGLQIDQGSLAA